MKNYVGIDPGQQGGIAWISPPTSLPSKLRGTVALALHQMPDSPLGITAILGCLAVDLVVLERAQSMPKQGIAGAFNYGVHYGTLIGILTAMGIPFVEVRPAVWKKEILQGVADKADKKQVISFCKKLFPKASLIPPGCRVEKDGLAEALLLAEYGRRKNL